MKISFKTKNLERILTNEDACRKHFGCLAETVARRLEYIRSAASFAELRKVPGHFHELKFQAKGFFAITVKHPFRLILTPVEDYEAIAVIAIEDYHHRPRRILNYN